MHSPGEKMPRSERLRREYRAALKKIKSRRRNAIARASRKRNRP